MIVPLSWYLLLAGALFAIGMFGALMRRNGIVILLSVQLMLNAANLSAVAFARQLNDPTGRALVAFVLLVAIAETGLGAALVLVLHRQRRTLDVDRINLMNG